MQRWLIVGLWVCLLGLGTGCASIKYYLPGHSSAARTVPLPLKTGETRLALTTPARLPVPGGYELGLASEDGAVVAVVIEPTLGGGKRYFLRAGDRLGKTTVHYVNRFAWPKPDASTDEERTALRECSLGSFVVTVGP